MAGTGWSRVDTGRLGESIAAGFLTARGYRIIDRNVYFRFGEIDLVCCGPSSPRPWIFVEVRTVRTARFGLPEERFSPRKIARLHRLAQTYLMEQSPDLAGQGYRLDGVTVFWPRGHRLPRVAHWPGLSPSR